MHLAVRFCAPPTHYEHKPFNYSRRSLELFLFVSRIKSLP